MKILIGSESGENVSIDVLSGGGPGDAGWHICKISISAGACSAKYQASLRSEDFPQFRKQLQSLYKKLDGKACFNTMEEQLKLDLVGDGKGHVDVEGLAIDQPGIGNRLQFSFEIDQTHLPSIIRELETVEREYSG